MKLRRDLEGIHGVPIYFLWFRHRGSQLRAQQGYLTKFPAELFDVIVELQSIRASFPRRGTDDVPDDNKPLRRRAPAGRVTRVQDPVLRAAIEQRPLDVALKYYASISGTHPIKLGKPYDIRVTVDGVNRHAEVKGSAMLIDTVELTIDEVSHANDYAATDLIVVDGIEWKRSPDGSVTTLWGSVAFVDRLGPFTRFAASTRETGSPSTVSAQVGRHTCH